MNPRNRYFSAALIFGLGATGCVGAALGPDATTETFATGSEATVEASPLVSTSSETVSSSAPLTFSTATKSGLLTFAQATTQCIDVWGINRTAGAPVYAFTCNSGVNQQFAFNQNQLVVYGNRCLEWTAASASAAASVHIALCDAAQPQQTWLEGSDSFFHAGANPSLCLTAPSIAQGSGVLMTVSPCGSPNAYQAFAFADAVVSLPRLSTNTLPIGGQPAVPAGVIWVDPPANYQLFPSSGSLDWSRYIVQGAVGDCTFMSGLGSVAAQHHELVRGMIKAISPHFYEASFYSTTGSNQSTPSLLVKVQIDDKLPIYQNSRLWFAARPVEDEISQQPVLFVVLLEKAWARYVESYQLPGFPDNKTMQGYAGTVGNSPTVAFALTGSSNLDTDRTGFNANTAWPLLSMVEQGYPVTTYKAVHTPDGLPGGHVLYVLRAFTDASGTQMVTIRNPWGQDSRVTPVKLVGSPGATFTMPYTTYVAEFNEICVGLIPGA